MSRTVPPPPSSSPIPGGTPTPPEDYGTNVSRKQATKLLEHLRALNSAAATPAGRKRANVALDQLDATLTRIFCSTDEMQETLELQRLEGIGTKKLFQMVEKEALEERKDFRHTAPRFRGLHMENKALKDQLRLYKYRADAAERAKADAESALVGLEQRCATLEGQLARNQQSHQDATIAQLRQELEAKAQRVKALEDQVGSLTIRRQAQSLEGDEIPEVPDAEANGGGATPTLPPIDARAGRGTGYTPPSGSGEGGMQHLPSATANGQQGEAAYAQQHPARGPAVATLRSTRLLPGQQPFKGGSTGGATASPDRMAQPLQPQLLPPVSYNPPSPQEKAAWSSATATGTTSNTAVRSPGAAGAFMRTYSLHISTSSGGGASSADASPSGDSRRRNTQHNWGEGVSGAYRSGTTALPPDVLQVLTSPPPPQLVGPPFASRPSHMNKYVTGEPPNSPSLHGSPLSPPAMRIFKQHQRAQQQAAQSQQQQGHHHHHNQHNHHSHPEGRQDPNEDPNQSPNPGPGHQQYSVSATEDGVTVAAAPPAADQASDQQGRQSGAGGAGPAAAPGAEAPSENPSSSQPDGGAADPAANTGRGAEAPAQAPEPPSEPPTGSADGGPGS